MTIEPDQQRSARELRSWYRPHRATLLVVLIVAAPLLAKNVWFGPRRLLLWGSYATNMGWYERYDVLATEYGWPLPYLQRVEHVLHTTYRGTEYDPKGVVAPAKTGRYHDTRVMRVAANIALAALILICTAISTEYWVCHRTGPFQFSLRSLFLLTTLVAVALAGVRSDALAWTSLLYLPIALGVTSVAFVGGLLLEASFRNSDARLSRLRRRFD